MFYSKYSYYPRLFSYYVLNSSFGENVLVTNWDPLIQVARLAILAKRPSVSPVPTPSSFVAPPLNASSPPTSSTELGLNNIQAPPNLSELAVSGPSVAEIASRPLCLTDAEKIMVVELAVSAMEELAQVAQAGEPLWVPDPSSNNTELLDNEEYLQQFPSVIGPTPYGLKVEATRETDLVMMDAPTLIETLMNVVLTGFLNRNAFVFHNLVLGNRV